MIAEGVLVKVVAREQSPPSVKYEGRIGRVTTTSWSVYGTLFFVQMDDNLAGVDTAFDQQDLEVVQGLDRESLAALPDAPGFPSLLYTP